MLFNTDLSTINKEISKGGFTLFPHQKYGIKWLINIEKKFGGGLLADEMGLGKTIQIISMMVAHPKPLNLIVCPASLVKQWTKEIEKFAPSIKVWTSYDSNMNVVSEQNVIVVSYNKINKISILRILEYDRVICDEAHYFRNKKSKTFKSLYALQSKIRWALTGTPIQNYKSDLVSIFRFLRKYVSLETCISKYMLRRTHDGLNFQLPNLNHNIKFIGVHNKGLINLIEDNDYMFHLERVLRLKQACIIPNQALKSIEHKYELTSCDDYVDKLKLLKLNKIVRDVLSKFNEKTDEKTIIFSYFRNEIRYLYEKLRHKLKIDYIDGSTTPAKKAELINSTNHDILIIQINAGGTGLNLQHYNNVIFTGPQWNPTLEQQAVARVYRIGQMKDVVVKRYIVGKMNEYSIEKRILKIQQKKLELIKKYIN
jgi:SNF2 family DNA or RNA helicase